MCSPGRPLGPGGGRGPSCCILLREEHWGPYLLFKLLNNKAPLVYLSLLVVIHPPPALSPPWGRPPNRSSPALPGGLLGIDSVWGWSWESGETFISFQMVQMFLPSDHAPPPYPKPQYLGVPPTHPASSVLRASSRISRRPVHWRGLGLGDKFLCDECTLWECFILTELFLFIQCHI